MRKESHVRSAAAARFTWRKHSQRICGLLDVSRSPRNSAKRRLMFLVHPTLTDADMHETADAVEKVLAHATR